MGSGGTKVLGKLSVSGRPTYLDKSRVKAYSLAFSACGCCLDLFFTRLSFLFSFPLAWESARYRLNYCLKRPFNQIQSTNQSRFGVLNKTYSDQGKQFEGNLFTGM